MSGGEQDTLDTTQILERDVLQVMDVHDHQPLVILCVAWHALLVRLGLRLVVTVRGHPAQGDGERAAIRVSDLRRPPVPGLPP